MRTSYTDTRRSVSRTARAKPSAAQNLATPGAIQPVTPPAPPHAHHNCAALSPKANLSKMHARAVVATPAAAFDTGSIAAVSRHLFTPPSKPWPSQQQAHARCRCASNRTHCAIGTANSHISSRTASRAVCCRAKAASATATVAAAAAAASASPELEPQVAFLAQLVSQGVLLPILAGWTFVTALSAVARRARQVRRLCQCLRLLTCCLSQEDV